METMRGNSTQAWLRATISVPRAQSIVERSWLSFGDGFSRDESRPGGFFGHWARTMIPADFKDFSAKRDQRRIRR
jgi:hypothetical protein